MYKTTFQTIFFISCVVISGSALAISYTTKGNKTIQQKENAQTSQCSDRDLASIKRFNRRAEKKVKEMEELSEIAEKVNTDREARDFSKDGEKVLEFFISEEYEEMRVVYGQCGLEIPSYNPVPPFWFSQNIH